jgi:ketosteroid isomerase-like protein
MSRTASERVAIRYRGLVRRAYVIATRVGAVRNPTLEQFRAVFLAGNEAFNRGDFTSAFAGLAPDCEWHPLAYATERALVGREQVCRFFEHEIFGTFPDWRTDPVDFLQAGDGVFVVFLRGSGTGPASGVPTRVDLAEVWELREGIPVRVREFPTWEDALTAAGLDPSAAARARGA